MDAGTHTARQLLEEVFAILAPDLAPSQVTWRSELTRCRPTVLHTLGFPPKTPGLAVVRR